MKTTPYPLPSLSGIGGEALARFCQRHAFPLERMANRFPGEWWLFLFLTDSGLLLHDLEELLGVRQLEAVGPFVEQSDWRNDFPDWDAMSSPERLAALRAALRQSAPAPYWWENGLRPEGGSCAAPFTPLNLNQVGILMASP